MSSSDSTGILRDVFGNYTVAFSLAGVPPMIGGVVLFFVPLIHSRLQRGQAPPDETSTTSHMLPSAPPAGEPKSCLNGDLLPGYTDVETHIWVTSSRFLPALVFMTVIKRPVHWFINIPFPFAYFAGIQPTSTFLILRLPVSLIETSAGGFLLAYLKISRPSKSLPAVLLSSHKEKTRSGLWLKASQRRCIGRWMV